MNRRTFIGAAVLTLSAGCTTTKNSDTETESNMEIKTDQQDIDLGGWEDGTLFRISDKDHDNQLYVIDSGDELSIAVA